MCSRNLGWALRLILLGALTVAAIPSVRLCAQGTRADYDRARTLEARTRDKVFRARVQPHWLAGGDRFWYRNDLPDGAHEFLLVDAVKGQRASAFDHGRLAEALGKAVKKSVKATHLPIDRLVFAQDGAIHFPSEGKTWRFDPGEGSLKEAPLPKEETSVPLMDSSGRGERRPEGSPRDQDSPDGKYRAFVRDFDPHLREKTGGAEFPLSYEGAETDGYEPAVWWAPDSRKLVAFRTAKGDSHTVHLIESTPPEQLQPKLRSHEYLKPGDRIPVSRPHLFDVAARKEIPIDGDLCPNPWSIEEVRWSPDAKRFTFLYNERGHQVLRVVAVDAETGHATPLVEERSKTFIDYAHKRFLHFMDKTGELLWMSERDGWNHLYLIDARTGLVKNQVTRGDWVVRRVERVNEETRQVWFQAYGLHGGQDPYHAHFARANFDGHELVALTAGDGTHRIEVSPQGRWLVDTYSCVDLPPVTELRAMSDGSLICTLEKADWSALLAIGWRPPERFKAKGRDGKTDIFGVIYRPTNYTPEKKYPVIEAIYAGPQGAFVPKAFAPFHRPQALAELGFILVQIDGMGTNWRSKAFHDVCWKNLADAGFPDRILWLKAAAAKDPSMDLTRVGLYGGSAGGQNALGGLLLHGDFYKVGAADCGCHDNRMDKIWWNELWMGWPLGPHYAEQSNATLAHRLQGKLLLTVGELDHNVDPASTFQVVKALIKANKDFELIVFPGADHGAGESEYGRRRRADFFVRHLLGVEPQSR
jgi:dipeptidyl aminopeptidase/acylaminoacyl peptidase